jgi:hypothetical protein
VADEIRRVLDAIVRHWVVNTEQRAVELDASAADSGAEIESDKQEAVRRELGRAEELAPAFEQGLVQAWQRSRVGGAEIALDDRDPDQNRIADALIRFLVSYDLASSRSTETDANHYIYAVTIDWDRLGDVAREAGIDLPEALDRLAERSAR